MADRSPEVVRAQIARIAIEEEGNRDVSRYWLDVLERPEPKPKDGKGKALSWCGAFALWCLHQAECALDVKWLFGLGFLRVARGKGLSITKSPKVGDIAYLDAPYQHHAVVIEIGPLDANGIPEWVSTANGNSGPTAGGRVVLRFRQPLRAWTCFYDTTPILDADVPNEDEGKHGLPFGELQGEP